MNSSSPTPPVALITGAARRIGAAIASQLHHKGYNLVLHYNRSQAEVAALASSLNAQRENSAAILQADLLNLNSIEALAQQAIAQWQRLDALINNASTFFPTAVGDIREDDYDDLMGTNFRAPLFLSQACTPALKRSKGCIINIADIHGERPLSGHPVYCSAKAANIMLTRSLAKELGPDIRVNGVAPGAILWPSQEDLSDSVKQTILKRTALKRIGSPDDIAKTIAFLLTEAPYITGQIIAVDGGRNLVS